MRRAAQTASVEVGIDKARTAATFVRPSRELEEQVSGGRLGALALHGAAALTGGIPLTVDGEVVGAIGTSGETPDEDESVSLAGAAARFSTVEVPALTYVGARLAAEAAADAPPPRATLFRAAEIRDRFTTGGLLAQARGYALDAGRRTGPGEVELHERVTDVMHVVQGTATVVTGGEGGDAHDVGPGDVLVIPAGVPHEFTGASDPFLYLVVKVEG